MRDMNTNVEADNINRELIIGRQGIRQQKENGELFTEIFTFIELVIGGKIFLNTTNKITYISPDGKIKNQIDHITIRLQLRRSMHGVMVKHRADVASDHLFIFAVLMT